MSEVVWIRALPRDPATAAQVEILLAGGGQDKPYRHPVSGDQYRAGVVRRPLYSTRLGFDEKGWSGNTQPQTSPVAFSTADPALRAKLAGLIWDSAPVTIDTGAEGAVPENELTGKVKDAEFTRAGMTLTIVDLGDRLEQPIVSSSFEGSGGIEGPSEASGRPKRRSFGYVFNVEGRLIDAANSIYEFGDPAFPLTGWNALRDKGRDGPIDTLAWQGSIADTFTALQASAPQDGGGVVAPSIACAKWWTVPSGPVTADLIGSAGTGGSMQSAALADAISALAGGPSVADLAGANDLRPSLAGIHIASDRESYAQAMDRLLLGVSLLWLPRPDGTMAILPWAFDDNAAVLKAEFKGRSRTYPPHGTRRLGFLKNERVQSDGEIAQVLVEGEQGPPGPAGVSAFTLTDLANTDVGIDSITKNGGGTGWNASAYSRESFVGGAIVSAVAPVPGTSIWALGLSENPTSTTDVAKLSYAFYTESNGSCYAYEDGANFYLGDSYIGGDVLSVHYDGKSIRYLKNGDVLRTADAPPNLKFFLDSSILSATGEITGIRFSAAGTAGDEPIAVSPPSYSATVSADAAGVVNADELPIAIEFKVSRGTTDLTNDALTSYAVSNASVASFTDNVLSITSVNSDTLKFTVTISYNGEVVATPVITTTKSRQGSAGGSQSVTAFTPPSASTYGSPNAGPLTLFAAPGQTVGFSCNTTFSCPSGTVNEAGKFQYRTSSTGDFTGTSWSDVAPETIGDIPAQGSELGSLYFSETVTNGGQALYYQAQLLLRKTSGFADIQYQGGKFYLQAN